MTKRKPIYKKQALLILSTLITICSSALVLSANAVITADVEDEIPVASSVLLNAGLDINLIANMTTTINATATITHNNGCELINSVQAALYRTAVGSGSADNNRNHYSTTCVSLGDCSGPGDFTETYLCEFDMYWYADPTDIGSAYDLDNWTVNVTPRNIGGLGISDTDSREVNTLTAFGLFDTSLSFGTIALGANTGMDSFELRMQNHGNEEIDLNLHSYATIDGDGLAMNCTVGSIEASYLEYSTITEFGYGMGTAMTGIETHLLFGLEQGSDINQRPMGSLYFGFGLPAAGVGGSCAGTIVISAVSTT